MEKQAEQETKTNKPINKKKTILSVIIVVIITVVVFTILFSFNDIDEVFKQLASVDGNNMWYAAVCLILYFIFWPLSLCLIARSNKFNTKFTDNYLIGGSEHFFNSITPFSTGGQPIQIYLYTQKKVKASHSTGIIVANFIALMIASNIYAVTSLVYYSKFSENFTGSTAWIIGLGFAMNLFTLFFMIAMATSKRIRNWLKNILVFLCRSKFIGKYLTKMIPVFETYCENAQSAAKEIFSHKLVFVGAVLLRMIALFFYYLMPFFILRAFNVELGFELIPFIVLASAFAITTMVWVPTPGGTGGIEFAFTTIFTASMFGGVTAAIGTAAMVIWRGLTYYLLMILSFITYISYEIKLKRHRIKEKKELDAVAMEEEVND